MTIHITPPPVVAPYWSPLIIDGQSVDLSHLEPLQIACPCAAIKRDLVIDVTFTNHCFTDHFVADMHDPTWKIMDHQRERVFCFTRHTLSLGLPAIVRGLPGRNVHQTRHERNFVYATTVEGDKGDAYATFFRIKRDRKGPRDLTLVVESAYPIDAPGMTDVLYQAPKVKFDTVCAHAFQGKPMQFRKRG